MIVTPPEIAAFTAAAVFVSLRLAEADEHQGAEPADCWRCGCPFTDHTHNHDGSYCGRKPGPGHPRCDHYLRRPPIRHRLRARARALSSSAAGIARLAVNGAGPARRKLG